MDDTKKREFDTGFIKVRGVKWYYETCGAGDTVVFLHGGLESIAAYSKLAEFFAQNFRVILMDRRGHGRSYDSDEPYSYSGLADEVAEFLQQMDISKAHIIGYSDGGNIAMNLAYKYPELCAKFIGVSINYNVSEGLTDGFHTMVENLSAKMMQERNPDLLQSYNCLSPEPDFDKYVEKGKPMWLYDPIITTSEISKIKATTLIIGGDRDAIPLAHLCDIYQLIPDARLCIIPNTDHFFFQDHRVNTKTSIALQACEAFLLE